MRSGEIARLSGVSARMLRHYHRLGLLPEPDRTPGGYRDYTTAHLVRVLRIRMFAEAGVPLREVSALLSETDGAADLDPLLQELDARIETLQLRRARLAALSEAVRAGSRIGTLPPRITAAMETLREEAAEDPLLLELLAREQEALELLASTQGLPDEFHEAYRHLAEDPSARARYRQLLERTAQLRGRDPADSSAQIGRLARDVLADPLLSPLLIPVGGIEPDAAGDALEADEGAVLLSQLLPDPAQRAVVEQIIAHLRSEDREADGT